jgi:uncharacterized protein (TIGR00266 family)
MQHTFSHRPTSTTLELVLDTGEQIVVQPGSMQIMDTGFDIAATTGGALAKRGVFGSARSVLAGESLVRVTYTAKRDGQRLALATHQLGDLAGLVVGAGAGHDDAIRCTGGGAGWYVARGAWLASAPSVELTVRYAGVRGWMASSGLFLLHGTGEGLMFCVGHGSLARRDLAAGERVLLDNKYIVAFEDTVQYELVTLTKELGTAALSGEGLVNRYTGPGTIVYQTRGSQRSGGFLSVLAQTVF